MKNPDLFSFVDEPIRVLFCSAGTIEVFYETLSVASNDVIYRGAADDHSVGTHIKSFLGLLCVGYSESCTYRRFNTGVLDCFDIDSNLIGNG